MAEGASGSGTPTFKLVLVGDGGTGKVCKFGLEIQPHQQNMLFIPARLAAHLRTRTQTNTRLDHLRQASFDWRVREEVHCDSRC